jgi:hypothetical protein
LFSGVALSREVDRVLELIARVKTPVHRESLVKDLAARLDLPVASLREQWRMRGGVRAPQPPAARAASTAAPASAARDPRERRAWEEIAGALVADASLIPLARARTEQCPEADLARVLAAVLDLYGREDASIDAGSVMNLLADDPARDLVVPLVEKAATAESPREQLEGALRRLRACEQEAEGARRLREAASQENLRLAGSARPD